MYYVTYEQRSYAISLCGQDAGYLREFAEYSLVYCQMTRKGYAVPCLEAFTIEIHFPIGWDQFLEQPFDHTSGHKGY